VLAVPSPCLGDVRLIGRSPISQTIFLGCASYSPFARTCGHLLGLLDKRSTLGLEICTTVYIRPLVIYSFQSRQKVIQ